MLTFLFLLFFTSDSFLQLKFQRFTAVARILRLAILLFLMSSLSRNVFILKTYIFLSHKIKKKLNIVGQIRFLVMYVFFISVLVMLCLLIDFFSTDFLRSIENLDRTKVLRYKDVNMLLFGNIIYSFFILENAFFLCWKMFSIKKSAFLRDL